MDIQKKLRERLTEVEGKKVHYSAVVLDEKSRSKLLAIFGSFTNREANPDGWVKVAHHMTIGYGKSLQELGLGEDEGKTIPLKVIEYGMSDMAIAVKVEGYKTLNKLPHITVAVNKAEGDKPVMSNDITNWKPVQSPLTLQGTVTNVTN